MHEIWINIFYCPRALHGFPDKFYTHCKGLYMNKNSISSIFWLRKRSTSTSQNPRGRTLSLGEPIVSILQLIQFHIKFD